MAVTLTLTSPTNNQHVTTETCQVTASATPSSGKSISDWQIYLDNNLWWTRGTGGGGTLNQNFSLPPGVHTFALKAWDSGGASAVQSVTLYVEIKDPTVTSFADAVTPIELGLSITSPAANGHVYTDGATFAGNLVSLGSPASSLQIYLDNNLFQTFASPSASFSYQVNFPPGVHSMVCKLWNGLGWSFTAPAQNVYVEVRETDSINSRHNIE